MKKDLVQNIIKLREEGLTYNEISEKLQCAKSTISIYCDKNNLGEGYLRLREFKISKDDINLVLELRNNNNTYEAIKEKSGLSKDRISIICRTYKISGSFNLTKPSNDIINEMQNFYNDCQSTIKVAKEFGYNKSTVSKYLIIKRNEKLSEEDYKIKRKKDVVKAVVNWRKDKKRKLVEYKGGKCEKCGYDKCIDAFDFHHKDPTQKDFGISAKSYSYERLKKEVDKCILVCKNCHSEIHYDIKNKNGTGA